MSVESFIPELWEADLLVALETRLVFGSPIVVNRNYEGEITQQGDSVNINSVGDPTISSYTKNTTTVTPENLDTAAQKLIIDQGKYFAFSVDDVDRVQAAGNLSGEAMRRAGYQLRKTADTFVAGLYTSVAAGNQTSATHVTSGNAYEKLIDLGVTLDESDTPEEGRYAVVPPWYYGLLLKDERFIHADKAGTDEGLRNGVVGQVDNMTILKSNQCVSLDSGDDNIVQAGYSGAITYADQIIETEAYRSQTRFEDVVRGLHVYGAKVTRPDNLATLQASQSSV